MNQRMLKIINFSDGYKVTTNAFSMLLTVCWNRLTVCWNRLTVWWIRLTVWQNRLTVWSNHLTLTNGLLTADWRWLTANWRFRPLNVKTLVYVFPCEVTYIEGSTNSRIHHFLPQCITFNHHFLPQCIAFNHYFLPQCIAFNQTALRHLLPECIAPRTTRGCHTVEPFLMQHVKVCKSGQLWHLNFKFGRILKWREMAVTKDYRIFEPKQNSTIAHITGI